MFSSLTVCFPCSLQDSLSLSLCHCSRPGQSCLAPPPLYYGSRTLWTIRHIGTHRRPKIIAQTPKKTDVCLQISLILSLSFISTFIIQWFLCHPCLCDQQYTTNYYCQIFCSALMCNFFLCSQILWFFLSHKSFVVFYILYYRWTLWCTHLVHFSKWLQDTTQHGHYIVGGYVYVYTRRHAG